MRPEERKARAYAAQALLNDETLQQGWNEIEADLIAEWAKPAGYGDERAKAAREAIWIELQVLRKLRQRLASFSALGRD